jgi:transcriptional regulator with XRE-family HTH domain
MRVDPTNPWWQFGQRLKAARIARKASLAEVARTVGVTAGYLSMVERGTRHPTRELTARLAEACAVGELCLGRPSQDPRVLFDGWVRPDPRLLRIVRDFVEAHLTEGEVLDLYRVARAIARGDPLGRSDGLALEPTS